MKKLLPGFWLISIFCFAQEVDVSKNTDDSLRDIYVNSISVHNLKDFVYHLAADSMEGRNTGSPGQNRAKRYIFSEFSGDRFKIKIDSSSTFQKFIIDGKLTENIIIGFPGSTKKDEFVIVGAHYDHVGIEDNKIYNGADDNASGTASVMEMIRVLSNAIFDGYRPQRTIVFILFSAEELGLWGSKVFVDEFNSDYSSIYANLNIDMVGRVDKFNKKNKSYVYTVGSDYFSDDLENILNEINEETVNLKISKKYNSIYHSSLYHLRTDSFPFAAEGIPFIFFTSGEHEDYHKETDTAEKIEFNELTERTQLIFAVLWELANREAPLDIDEKKVNNYKSQFKFVMPDGEK